VATSPNGRIYKVDQTGKGTVFYDPPDAYIWSLAVDRAGALFAGTGDKGTIYKITPDGRGAVFYQTKATHAMTLAFDREGRLLAGTGAPGRVFRLDAAGKPFVLFDSSYGEIHALRVDGSGTIYAAAISGRPGAAGAAAAHRVRRPRSGARRRLDRNHLRGRGRHQRVRGPGPAPGGRPRVPRQARCSGSPMAPPISCGARDTRPTTRLRAWWRCHRDGDAARFIGSRATRPEPRSSRARTRSR
jgi:sugar lactone lactonase YvrE